VSLIITSRHTERDLAHWHICEQEDDLHAQRLAKKLEEKAARAMDEMRSFIETAGRGYLGVSWGKDSVVCAWMLHQLGIAYPAVWVRVREWENPDCLLVRDAFLERFPLRAYEEIEVEAGENRAGGTSARGFEEAARRHGDAHISGVRGDESTVRRWMMRRCGIATDRTCRPIGWWSTRDVFAFSRLHDLPLHPAYGYTMGGVYDRLHLRTASLGGTRGQGHGRAEWERAYYGVAYEGTVRHLPRSR
jgi:phosphoadenosine phosphosulfate reductase